MGEECAKVNVTLYAYLVSIDKQGETMTDMYNFIHDLWVIHEKELMEVNYEIDCYSTPDELLELSRTWSVESSVCDVLEKILKEMNPDFDVIGEMLFLHDGVEV